MNSPCFNNFIRYSIVGILLLLCSSLQAQQSAKDSTTNSNDSLQSTTSEDSILTFTELSLRIEEASQSLHQIENNKLVGDTITIVIPEFQSFASAVQSVIATQENENLSTFNLNQLKNADNKLLRFKTKLEHWQEDINKQTEGISKQKRVLNSIKTDFTNQNLWLEDSSLLVLFEDRVAQIKEQDSILNERTLSELKQLITVQNQLAEQKILINNQLEDIKYFTLHYQLNLFERDTPLLWQQSDLEETTFSNKLGIHVHSGVLLLKDYLRENNSGLYLQLVCLILLLIILYSIRGKALQLKENAKAPDVNKMIYVLKYPWGSALLVTLLVGPLLYNHPPSLLIQFSFVLMLIPLIVIVEGRKDKSELASAILISLAYTLTELESILLGNSLGQRILLLIASFLALCCILIFIRQSKKRPEAYPSFFYRILLIFITVFCIAMIANILGYSSLASMLNLATTQSLIFGILLFFCYRVVVLLIVIFTFSHRIQRTKLIKENQKVISANLRQLSSVLLVFYWLSLSLASFNLFDLIYEAIRDFLLASRSLGSMEFSYWSIIVFVLVIWASVILSRLIKYFLEQQYMISASSEKNKKGAFILLTRYFILLFGFFLAIVAAGIPIDKVTIILGALSVGIGFGLQNIVNNLVSGFILALERPIQTGDVIEVGAFMGVVQDIGIRSSTIKTFDGSEVIVPNANFISGEVTNWTLSDKHYRIEILVGAAYGSDTSHVIEVLKQTLENHDEIMKVPEPMVIFQGFGDSSLDFRVLFWCKNRDQWVALRSKIMEAIYKRFNQEKIEIPFPQRDLHIKTDNPPTNGHPLMDKKKTAHKTE